MNINQVAPPCPTPEGSPGIYRRSADPGRDCCRFFSSGKLLRKGH